MGRLELKHCARLQIVGTEERERAMGRARWWVNGVSVAALGALALWRLPERTMKVTVRCEPGTARSYRFAYESKGEANTGVVPGMAGPGEPTRIELVLEGIWEETCVEQRDGASVMRVAVRDVSGQIGGNTAGLPAAADSLASEAFVEISSAGRVGAIRHAAPEGSLSAHFVRDLLSLRSFELAAELRDGVPWQAEERDIQGRYRSTYRLISVETAAIEFEKRREAYVPEPKPPAHDAGESGPRVLPDSGGRIRLARDGGSLVSLSMTASLESWLSGERLEPAPLWWTSDKGVRSRESHRCSSENHIPIRSRRTPCAA